MPDMQDQTLSCDGFRFLYRILHGNDSDRIPVLFLGGAFQSMNSWKRIVPAFHPERTVLLVDLPGMGQADFLPESYGLEFFTGVVRTLLDEVGCPQVCVVSASYGALIGYQFAQLFPSRVSHLALAGIMWRVSRQQKADALAHVEELDRLPPDDYATEVIDRLLSPTSREHVQRSRVVERVLRTELKRIDEDGLRKYRANMLRLCTQPPLNVESPPVVRSLIFTGEHDHFTRPRFGRALASRMDDAVVVEIEQADHLCHMERFETTTELVRRFFDNDRLDGIPGCGALDYYGSAGMGISDVDRDQNRVTILQGQDS